MTSASRKPREILDPKSVAKLSAPSRPDGGDSRQETSDTEVRSLRIRTSPGGRKVFILRARLRGEKNPRRWKLGQFVEQNVSTINPDADLLIETPFLTLAQARDKARAYNNLIKQGVDPEAAIETAKANAKLEKIKAEREAAKLEQEKLAAELRAAQNTFGAVVERFLEDKSGANGKVSRRAFTLRDYKRVLKGDDFSSIRDKPIEEITDIDIDDILDNISKRTGAASVYYAFARLRGLFLWARTKKILKINPMETVEKRPRGPSRERVLDDVELAIVYKSMDAAGILAPAFRLLALTGQRLREICSLEIDEIHDLDKDSPYILLPEDRTKNKRKHIVPLSPMAADILKQVLANRDKRFDKSPYVFTTTGDRPVSGYSKAKSNVDEKFKKLLEEQDPIVVRRINKKTNWVLHDLRRTFSTGLSELRVDDLVIELSINHYSGKLGGVAGIYNHAKRLDERREAMNLWAKHIQKLIDPDDGATMCNNKRNNDNVIQMRTA